MVQLTIDNATMRQCQSRIRNPTSPISRPGRAFQMSRLSHLSHPSQMFAMFPMFPMFPLFAMFPRTRNARKKQNTKNCEISCRRPARQQGLITQRNRRNSQKPGRKTQRRFTRFKCFRRFISFKRFNRFRCIYSSQKMKPRPTAVAAM